ncbi:MAG TPA: CBS domain-containing protein [Usitatibacter sp.]|nr:CBS domain-containing protein [Usitatibacter sp.]
MREYSPLDHVPLAPRARLARPEGSGRVTLDDPAFAVMTDLREVPAATTTPGESVDRAHAYMLQRGVRLLFVVDRDGAIEGVITATDILGEKPVRVTQSRGIPRGELAVADLMTPATLLEALALQDVSQMRVGHVVATLKQVRRQHVMVCEDGGRVVRGLFSASKVARQLGVQLQTFEVASTFADIEAALART